MLAILRQLNSPGKCTKLDIFYDLLRLNFRGDVVLDEKSENLTLNNLGLESEQNISCSAVNEIGSGEADVLQFDVFGNKSINLILNVVNLLISVPPTFIEHLPEESFFLSSGEDISVACQVIKLLHMSCHSILYLYRWSVILSVGSLG